MSSERTINRDAAMREMIEAAISVFMSGQSWACAITLARAAQQYLHEKLKHLGEKSTLAHSHQFLSDEVGLDLSFKDYADDFAGFANLLKHARDSDEADSFNVTGDQVGRLIELAIADYRDAVGDPTPAMLAFVGARLIASTGVGGRDVSIRTDVTIQRLKARPKRRR